MSKFAIRLLTPATYAAGAGGSSRGHTGQGHDEQQQTLGSWLQRSPVGQAWPVTRPSSQAGAACPGNARSIDCRMWPPPFDVDPDRKVSGFDGGYAMKVIEEYLENALAFEQLSAVEIDPTLKDDFEKQAVAFRKLAAERAKRLGLGPPENSN